jgi:hypothetical protein
MPFNTAILYIVIFSIIGAFVLFAIAWLLLTHYYKKNYPEDDFLTSISDYQKDPYLYIGNSTIDTEKNEITYHN